MTARCVGDWESLIMDLFVFIDLRVVADVKEVRSFRRDPVWFLIQLVYGANELLISCF